MLQRTELKGKCAVVTSYNSSTRDITTEDTGANTETEKEYIFNIYIIVHDMVHLLERKHNDNFTAIMDHYLPKWRFYKEELNRLQVNHESWNY